MGKERFVASAGALPLLALLLATVVADAGLLVLWTNREGGDQVVLAFVRLSIPVLIYSSTFVAARLATRSATAQFMLVYFFFALIATTNLYLIYAVGAELVHSVRWNDGGAETVAMYLQECYSIGAVLFGTTILGFIVKALWSRLAKVRAH